MAETILDRLLIVLIDRTTNDTPLELQFLFATLELFAFQEFLISRAKFEFHICEQRPEPPDCFFKRSR
jgi:hypothetical protein